MFFSYVLYRASITKCVFTYLILVFFHAGSYAQDEFHQLKPSNFKLLENEQSNNEIYFEDSYGFIWMGTQYGLARYDVHSVKKYRHEVGNPKSLKPYQIKAIFEDSKKNLWIGTDGGGLSLLDREKEEFTHFENNNGCTNCITGNKITSINEDDNGVLWVGAGRLNLIYGKDGEFQFREHPDYSYKNFPYESNDTLKSKYIYIDSFDRSGIVEIYNHEGNGIYIGTENGLYYLPYNNIIYDSIGYYKEFGSLQVPLLTKSGYHSNCIILSILIDNDLDLWLGTKNNGILVSKPDSNEEYTFFKKFNPDYQNKYSISGKVISSIKEDLKRNIWIGTLDGGINFISYRSIINSSNSGFDSLKFINVNNDLQKTVISNNSSIYDIHIDKSGIVWCGTLNKDFVYDYKQTKFDVIETNLEEKQGDIDNSISTIYVDSNDSIWIVTKNNGLFKVDYNEDRIDPYKVSKVNFQINYNERISQICDDPKNVNHFLIVTDQGLYRVNKSNWSSSKLSYFSDYFFSRSDVLSRFWVDNYNRIWLIHNGLYLLKKELKPHELAGFYNYNDKNIKTNVSLLHYDLDSLSLSNNKINSICQDSRNNLWIGTADGLNFLDSASFHNIEELYYKEDRKPRWAFFQFSWNTKYKKSPIQLHNNLIDKILFTNKGKMMIGTYGGGISIFNNYQLIETLNESDGLCSDFIISLLEDNDENIWIGTINGLSMYNPVNKSFINFDMSDGLSSMSFAVTDFTHKKTNSGQLLFGTENGLTLVEPGIIEVNKKVPNVFIT